MSIIPLFVVVPLAGAFVITLLGKKAQKLPENLTAAACLFTAGAAVLAACIADGTAVYKVGGWGLVNDVPVGILMVMDGLTSFMLVTTNVVALTASIFSISYMKRYTETWKFYALFLLMVAGMNGVIITGDMFNLYVFLEIAGVASYALVAFGTEREELEASFKYMVMGIVASSLILLGVVLLYSYTSALNMADISRFLAERGPSNIIPFITVLFIVGFGLKAALVPFHWWLPDAHPSAPAPISAMLSGVLIKVLGIYALMRIVFNVLGVTEGVLQLFIILGLVSMIWGGVMALGQTDIKRLLAYSSISQIGYIFAALGVYTRLALFGAVFYLLGHALAKSLLFLNSGAVEYATGTRDMTKMGGLRERMPVTSTTSVVGALSISGIPFTIGFFGKLIIVLAALRAGHLLVALVAVAVSILTLAYYLKLQKMTFFGACRGALERVREAPGSMRISMILLAILCLIGGFLLLPGAPRDFIWQAADALTAGHAYATSVIGGMQ